MDARFLSRIPIFASAGLILFLFLANLWNFAVERDWPKLRIRSSEPLAGVAKPRPAPWNLESFLDGETQHAVSANLGQNSPMFPISVRLKNQFMYSLFRASGVGNMTIGRDDELISTTYVDEFCARGGAPDSTKLAAWAEAVAQSRRAAAGQGKGFVYLISPSKAAYEPSWLPQSLSCPSLRDHRHTEKLAPYVAALGERGVDVVEAQALMRKARADYAFEMFPRGGIHWNLLGAAVAMSEISRTFATQPAGSPIGLYDFDWREVDVAHGTDRDLLDLLNLFWPSDRYPTASVHRRGPQGQCVKPPRLLMVGDSFLRELIVVVSQAACPPVVDYWFYMRGEDGQYTLAHFLTQPGDIGNGERLDADLAHLPESFTKADAVILEENASNLAEGRQAWNLLDAVRR